MTMICEFNIPFFLYFFSYHICMNRYAVIHRRLGAGLCAHCWWGRRRRKCCSSGYDFVGQKLWDLRSDRMWWRHFKSPVPCRRSRGIGPPHKAQQVFIAACSKYRWSRKLTLPYQQGLLIWVYQPSYVRPFFSYPEWRWEALWSSLPRLRSGLCRSYTLVFHWRSWLAAWWWGCLFVGHGRHHWRRGWVAGRWEATWAFRRAIFYSRRPQIMSFICRRFRNGWSKVQCLQIYNTKEPGGTGLREYFQHISSAIARQVRVNWTKPAVETKAR